MDNIIKRILALNAIKDCANGLLGKGHLSDASKEHIAMLLEAAGSTLQDLLDEE